MTYFAVHYTYAGDAERVAEHRPAHRDYLRSLTDSGLVAAGAHPDAEPPGALLIVRAESADQVTALLDGDPFRTEGLIVERRIVAWTPVIGVFAD